MRLNKTDREEFRKRVKMLIPQMEKSEIVNHFQKEVYPRKTIYDTLNRMQLGGTINDKRLNWLLNLQDTRQKKSSQKIGQEPQRSQSATSWS